MAQTVVLIGSRPLSTVLAEQDNRAVWECWQPGLTAKPTLCDDLPRLRMLLIIDKLAGHLTASFVVWLFEHGIVPLYTPLSGSWLNMTASIQRIVVGRALAGQTPANSAELIVWLEATARAWNADPSPFRMGWQTPTPSPTGLLNVAIRSADPEPVHVNHSVADSSSWTNGELPVK
jgi:hypothetical protein